VEIQVGVPPFSWSTEASSFDVFFLKSPALLLDAEENLHSSYVPNPFLFLLTPGFEELYVEFFLRSGGTSRVFLPQKRVKTVLERDAFFNGKEAIRLPHFCEKDRSPSLSKNLYMLIISLFFSPLANDQVASPPSNQLSFTPSEASHTTRPLSLSLLPFLSSFQTEEAVPPIDLFFFLFWDIAV